VTKQLESSPEALAHAMAGRVRRTTSVRIHMFLIVAASVAMATVVTAGLLAVGVDALWKRYLPALGVAYGTFFMGVWLWLHMTRAGTEIGVEPTRLKKGRKRKSKGKSDFSGGLDIPADVLENLPAIPARAAASVMRGGGGTFDGGGASASFADAGVGDSFGSSIGDTVGDAVGSAFGDEGGIALFIAIVLVVIALAMLFGAAGYVIYQAPAILSEVVFDLLLAQPLTQGMVRIDSARWFRVLFSRTLVPFLLVAAASLAFAAFAAHVAPQARTAGEVLRSL
jgi:uncharacterized membrane protein